MGIRLSHTRPTFDPRFSRGAKSVFVSSCCFKNLELGNRGQSLLSRNELVWLEIYIILTFIASFLR